ncbi:hypothetical protein HR11_09475 [Porphyromonas macacae]|nr:hypothetical protein HR11_09475 [Porphyromonas macacae]
MEKKYDVYVNMYFEKSVLNVKKLLFFVIHIKILQKYFLARPSENQYDKTFDIVKVSLVNQEKVQK